MLGERPRYYSFRESDQMPSRGATSVADSPPVTCHQETIQMGAAEVRIPLPPNVSGEELRTLAAVKHFEVGRVSLGQAAVLAGQSVRSFIEVLDRYRVPVVNYSPEDLEREIGS